MLTALFLIGRPCGRQNGKWTTYERKGASTSLSMIILVDHLSQTRAIQVSYPGLVSATAGVRIEVVSPNGCGCDDYRHAVVVWSNCHSLNFRSCSAQGQMGIP